MQFRNLTVPTGNKPVSIQFLAHDSFSKAVEKFLREHVIQFKELAVPLHLPTAQIREAASPKLSAVLQNFKAFDHLDHGHDGSHLSCCRPQLLDKVSPHIRRDVQRQFGLHVAVSLEDLILPPELRLLQYANANSTFFLTKKDFFTRFHAQVRSCQNTMDYHQSVMISLKNFWKRTGCYTRLSFNMLLGTPNSWWYASRPGCPDLALFIMLIMRLTNSLFFPLVFISKEHTEPGVTKIYLNLFWHGTRCYVGGFFCVVFKVAVQVPMGNSKGCEITNGVRLPEAEETVSQGSYSNFVFQVLLCCSHASYSTNHRLHVCTALATNLWSTFCSEYLAGHT